MPFQRPTSVIYTLLTALAGLAVTGALTVSGLATFSDRVYINSASTDNIVQVRSTTSGNTVFGVSATGTKVTGDFTVTGTCTGCGGAGSQNFQDTYALSAHPQLTLTALLGAFSIKDASTTTGQNLLEVLNPHSNTAYLNVSATSTNTSNAINIASSAVATPLLKLTPTGNASVSTSVGGAMLFTNTSNNGSGLVMYTNQAGPLAGANLLALRADSNGWNQNVLAISNDGSLFGISVNATGGEGGGISITSSGATHGFSSVYSGTGTSQAAGSMVSTNTFFTAFQVTGHEFTHGTIKLAHVGDGASSDANAAGISIDLKNSDALTGTTAAQGIFMTSTTGGTTGALLQLKNNRLAFGGADAETGIFYVSGNGFVGINTPSALTPKFALTVQPQPGTPTETIFGITKDNYSQSYFTVSSTSTQILTALIFGQTSTSNATYTVTATDTTVFLQPSGSQTVNLPTAVGQAGRKLVFKDTLGTSASNTNIVSITANGAELIDGAATRRLSMAYDSLTIMSNGTNWESVGVGKPAVRWLHPYFWSPGATSQAFTAGTEICAEFELSFDAYLDNITYVSGATAIGNVKVGIYGPIITEETSNGATLLVQSGTTSSVTANTPQAINLTAVTFAQKGRYYACIVADDSTNTFMRQSNQAQVTGWAQTMAGAGTVAAGFQTTMSGPTNAGSAIPAMSIRVAK